ncbi:hypothetical protein HMPREF1989_01484, partial [Porphyromonas gingivalis F0566]
AIALFSYVELTLQIKLFIPLKCNRGDKSLKDKKTPKSIRDVH